MPSSPSTPASPADGPLTTRRPVAVVPTDAYVAEPLVRLRGVQVVRADDRAGTGTTTDGALVGPLDLAVAPGERVGVVGRSGAGKSLTASVLCRTTPAGLRVTGDVALPDRVGLVAQESALALDPYVSVGDQLALACRPDAPGTTGRGGRRARRAAAVRRTTAMLADLGLDPATARAWPLDLSGGQRQRVALGLALLGEPDLLVADEPTASLDVVTGAAVVATIDRLLSARGTALVLVTHDLGVAARLCDRVVVLDDGRVRDDGPTADVLAAPRSAGLETRHPATLRLARAAARLGGAG